MTKIFVRFCCATLLAVCVYGVQASPTLASGTTNSATGAGQVRTLQDGEARYLGTEVNPGGNTTATSSTHMNTNTPTTSSLILSNLSFDSDDLPKGFFTDAESLFTDAINLAFILATLLVFFYLIWAGIDWITSGGDKGKIEGARNKIVNAVIGIVIVASSYAVLTLVLNLLGYESLNAVLTESQLRIVQ